MSDLKIFLASCMIVCSCSTSEPAVSDDNSFDLSPEVQSDIFMQDFQPAPDEKYIEPENQDIEKTDITEAKETDDSSEKKLKIIKIEPAEGKALELNTVSVYGDGFTEYTEIFFGKEKSLFPFFISGKIINVVTPPMPSGTVDVRAVNPDGMEFLKEKAYVFESDFLFESLNPDKGSLLGGTPVLIKGGGFSKLTALLFGGKPAFIKEIVDDSSVQVLTPQHEEGIVDVAAVFLNESDGTLKKIVKKKSFAFINDLPMGKIPDFKLIKVTPSQGSVSGGTDVIIHGMGLKQGISVRFGGLPATNVEFKGSTIISARTPPGNPGTVDVTGFLDDTFSMLKNGYEYTGGDTKIFMASPDRGSVAGGTYVRLYGMNFPEHFTVSVGNAQAQKVKRIDSNSIELVTAAGKPGFVDIVINWDQGSAVLKNGFLYFDPVNYSGGVSGEKIDGAVNVTVIDGRTGERLPDAYVVLGSAIDTQLKGRTDKNGQITLSSPDLLPPQTVTATKEKYDAETIAGFGGENVTLYLITIIPPEPSPVDPLKPQQCKISGMVSNVEKYIQIPDGVKGKRKITCATTISYFFSSNPDPGTAAIVNESREYEIISRTGNLAVYCIGGIETESSEFIPLRMGIHRGLSCADGQNITGIDINLTIPVDQDIFLKVQEIHPVNYSAGIPLVYIRLRLEGDGYIPFELKPHYLKNGIIDFHGLPAELKGELDGTSYSFYTNIGAKETYGIPYTVNFTKDAVPSDSAEVISGTVNLFKKVEASLSAPVSSAVTVEGKTLLSTFDGDILLFDGKEFSLYVSPGQGRILDLFGIDLMDVFACGEKGLILHIQGKSHEKIPAPLSDDISEICGDFSLNEIFIASGKKIYKYKDGSWMQQVLDKECDITDLFCQGNGSVWATCSQGLILHSTGGKFFSVFEATSALNAIAAENDNVYFAGDKGYTVRYSGFQFIPEYLPVDADFLAVHSVKTDLVYFTGEKGLLWIFDGYTYRDLSFQDISTDLSVIFHAGDSVFASGMNPVRIEPVLDFPDVMNPPGFSSKNPEKKEIWDKKTVKIGGYDGFQPHANRIILSSSKGFMFWYIISSGNISEISLPDFEQHIGYSLIPSENELKYLNIMSSIIPGFTMDFFTPGMFSMDKSPAWSVNFIQFY
jgi:hypothetical protein